MNLRVDCFFRTFVLRIASKSLLSNSLVKQKKDRRTDPELR